MPKAARSLQELDKLAAEVGASVGIQAEFDFPDGRRLIVSGGVNFKQHAGKRLTALDATVEDRGRRKLAPLVEIRVTKPSAAFRDLARDFPDVAFPPTLLDIYPNVASVRNDKVKRLVRAGLAEAFGNVPPPAAAPARKPVSTDPAEWAAMLKSGPPGVSKWNRLLAAERKAVDLAGADLAGADLTRAKLRGLRAKGASFAGATLLAAEFSGALLEEANLSTCRLDTSDLKEVKATAACFRAASLGSADLRRGVFVGASFAEADLSGADLSGANLRKADLASARLDDARFEGATFDAQTSWPAGFLIPAEAIFAGRGTDPRLSGKGKNAVAADINGLMARLHGFIDAKRMKRTLDMLKSGKNQLFAEVEPTFVRGIVRSQRDDDLYYSCVLTEDGTYSCATPDVSQCMGLSNEPCKHLLVLIIGLARAGQLDAAKVDPWLVEAKAKNPRWNRKTKDHISETLLRYRGVQAGEIDWRPTETVPEDFYTF